MKKLIRNSVLAFIMTVCVDCVSAQTSSERKQIDNNKANNSIMENKDYTTSFLVDQNASTVFHAITNLREWWSQEIEGKTDEIGETFFYHYKDVHLSRIKLIEVIPDKKVVYQVLANQFNFTTDKTEWINTKLIFEIIQEGDKIKVVFTHKGLVPEYECYAVCNDAWTSYIQGSLKSLITSGKGMPNPKEGGLNEELVNKWGLPKK